MKKQCIKSFFVLLVSIILMLIFLPNTSYGYTSFNGPQITKPSDTIVETTEKTMEEINTPIISMKSKLISFTFIIIFMALIYFIPTIICIVKRHTHKLYIICLNIFLGWTLIGWLGALIWSFIDRESIENM